MSESIDPAYREALLKHREWLEDARRSTTSDRDKMVLAIAGGVLGVSVTFLEKIAPTPTPWIAGFLILGWAFEVAAVVLVLLSLHSSDAAFWTERERVDTMLDGDGRDPGWMNLAQRRTEWQNNTASAAALIGIVLILISASLGVAGLDSRDAHSASVNVTAK